MKDIKKQRQEIVQQFLNRIEYSIKSNQFDDLLQLVKSYNLFVSSYPFVLEKFGIEPDNI